MVKVKGEGNRNARGKRGETNCQMEGGINFLECAEKEGKK